jgi:hypothetical protein
LRGGAPFLGSALGTLVSILIVEFQDSLRVIMANHFATSGISVRAAATLSQMDLEIQKKSQRSSSWTRNPSMALFCPGS